jgi:hypothetical protein
MAGQEMLVQCTDHEWPAPDGFTGTPSHGRRPFVFRARFDIAPRSNDSVAKPPAL